MQKLTFNSISQILPRRQRRKLLLLAIARILANGLDILGLAGIALLATAFGSLAAGSARTSPISLPILGEVYITEYEAVMVAMAVALMFLVKSFFSIWLNLRTSLTVAELEGGFAETLTRNYFSNEPTFDGSLSETVSKFQSGILVSTSSISGFLNARMTFIAESSLLIGLVVIFFFVNPLATIAILGYLILVVFAMSRIVNFRVRRNSLAILEGSELALNSSRELFGVRREVQIAGQLDKWLAKIVTGKKKAAIGNGVTYTLNSLPRYVIETSLILGMQVTYTLKLGIWNLKMSNSSFRVAPATRFKGSRFLFSHAPRLRLLVHPELARQRLSRSQPVFVSQPQESQKSLDTHRERFSNLRLVLSESFLKDRI